MFLHRGKTLGVQRDELEGGEHGQDSLGVSAETAAPATRLWIMQMTVVVIVVIMMVVMVMMLMFDGVDDYNDDHDGGGDDNR